MAHALHMDNLGLIPSISCSSLNATKCDSYVKIQEHLSITGYGPEKGKEKYMDQSNSTVERAFALHMINLNSIPALPRIPQACHEWSLNKEPGVSPEHFGLRKKHPNYLQFMIYLSIPPIFPISLFVFWLGDLLVIYLFWKGPQLPVLRASSCFCTQESFSVGHNESDWTWLSYMQRKHHTSALYLCPHSTTLC